MDNKNLSHQRLTLDSLSKGLHEIFRCNFFWRIRVYTRCATGMPGSQTAQEKLICRVLVDLLVEGYVAKLADDLYCGGNSLQDLSSTWRRLLAIPSRASLRLSASKTIVYPKQTSILDWVWSKGSLTAGPHIIATFSSCQAHKTVKGLVIPNMAPGPCGSREKEVSDIVFAPVTV